MLWLSPGARRRLVTGKLDWAEVRTNTSMARFAVVGKSLRGEGILETWTELGHCLPTWLPFVT